MGILKMIKILKKIRTSLKRDQIGAVALEYALLAPLFVAFTFGSLEIGRILMVYSALEGAVTESTRISITGNIPDGYATVEDYIKEYVENSIENVGVDTGVSISMKVYDSFSAIGDEEPYTDTNGNLTYDVGECYTDINGNAGWDADMGSIGAGGEENVMVMDISVDLPYMMHGVISAFSQSESINLSTTTAVRNEPYGGVAWEPSSNVICS